MLSSASHDTLAELMHRVFDEAWHELGCNAKDDRYRRAARAIMQLRLMTRIAAGERDIKRLKFLALQAVDGRKPLP